MYKRQECTQLGENIKEIKKQVESKADRDEAVSYTHLDVYKRQVNEGIRTKTEICKTFGIPNWLKLRDTLVIWC